MTVRIHFTHGSYQDFVFKEEHFNRLVEELKKEWENCICYLHDKAINFKYVTHYEILDLDEKMDKKIKKIQKDTKKLAKEEASLLKMDKKRDPACDLGKMMMKKK